MGDFFYFKTLEVIQWLWPISTNFWKFVGSAHLRRRFWIKMCENVWNYISNKLIRSKLSHASKDADFLRMFSSLLETCRAMPIYSNAHTKLKRIFSIFSFQEIHPSSVSFQIIFWSSSIGAIQVLVSFLGSKILKIPSSTYGWHSM